ncbi:MAG: autotransporter-associated beta strand repeat-containing protein, partial [Verrucomicrobiaceae bacterium]|nr:autotransporter-associated beta strand repeat-containing protein [Verrucomicrobiaceae bacterium]
MPTIHVAQNTATLNNVIAGSSGLTKTGAGTLALGGSNSYAGGTFLNAGVTQISADANLGDSGGGIVFGGNATLQITADIPTSGREITLNSGVTGTVLLRAGVDFLTTGKVTGAGNLVFNQVGNGARTFKLTNASNDFTGSLTIDVAGSGQSIIVETSSITDGAGDGNIQFGTSTFSVSPVFRHAGASPLELSNRKIEFINNGTGGATLSSSTAALTIQSDLVVSGTGVKTLTLDAPVSVTSVFNGLVGDGSGSLAVNKTGAGTWELNEANTYTGATTILASGGTLVANSLANGGAASSIGQSGNAATNLLLGNASTLRYTGPATSTDRSFTINGTSANQGATLDASGSGAHHRPGGQSRSRQELRGSDHRWRGGGSGRQWFRRHCERHHLELHHRRHALRSGRRADLEPFDDSNSTLTGNTAGTGLSGPWAGSGVITPGSLAYGSFPAGSGIKASFNNQNGYASVGTTLSNAGLLADGATLWFSMLVQTGADIGTNGDLGFAFGTDQINSGNNIPVANSGQALGFTFKALSLRASSWTPGTLTRSTTNSGNSAAAETVYLVAGEFIWGAATDTLKIYKVAVDLTRGPAVSTITANVNQSLFDTISIGSKLSSPAHLFDEIRFGATYEAAIGQAGSGPGPVDHFVISPIPSPQTVGTPITGITITARDAANQTATCFTGTVTFGGTSGFSGTSASFTAGVLSGVSITPAAAGNNLTFTVSGSGKTGSTTIATIRTQYDTWSGNSALDGDA